MSDKNKISDLVDGAYGVSTPQGFVDYYRDFSQVYDTDFIDGMGYCFPDHIAAAFHASAADCDALIADIGCGTGVVAEALALPAARIDGFDISPQMLALAHAKGLYHRLHEIDLTLALPPSPRGYGAVISAGTFTHGHLGPAHLIALHQWADADALFCIGINATYFEAHGFDAALRAEQRAGNIRELRYEEHRMYNKTGHSHENDTGLIAIYRS